MDKCLSQVSSTGCLFIDVYAMGASRFFEQTVLGQYLEVGAAMVGGVPVICGSCSSWTTEPYSCRKIKWLYPFVKRSEAECCKRLWYLFASNINKTLTATSFPLEQQSLLLYQQLNADRLDAKLNSNCFACDNVFFRIFYLYGEGLYLRLCWRKKIERL